MPKRVRKATHVFTPEGMADFLICEKPPSKIGKHTILATYLDAKNESRRSRKTRPDPARLPAPTWPELQARRRRGAKLLQRIFEVDPLRCLRRGDDLLARAPP